MRKGVSAYSKKALEVLENAERMGLRIWGDPGWALAEAAGKETPVGSVHLHWINHRGFGRWNIVTNPQWRGEICGTVRCRRVLILPFGGANESVPLGATLLDDKWDEWWAKKHNVSVEEVRSWRNQEFIECPELSSTEWQLSQSQQSSGGTA